MRRGLDWRCVLGAALAVAVAVVVLLAFSLMSRPGRQELVLDDADGDPFGWRYELLTDEGAQVCEPEFEPGQHMPTLPEGTRAVRITRTMAEELPNAELQWSSYLDGVEVFLDGELLHTDFRWEVARGDDGFLRPTREDWERLHRIQGSIWGKVRMSLPEDYLGRELCLITYFPEDWGMPVPEYPVFGNDDTYIAQYIVSTSLSAYAILTYGALALLLAAVFLLDIPNARADGRTLLLCLYFLLLFLNEAYASGVGYYSELLDRVNLTFLSELYVAPLYLYLALRLEGRWKYLLCGGVAAWALYEGARGYLDVRRGASVIWSRDGAGAFVLFLAVAAALCCEGLRKARQGRWDKRRLLLYGPAAVAVALLCTLGGVHGWGSVGAYLRRGIWSTLAEGNFDPAMTLITRMVSVMTLFVVITEFVRRTLRARRVLYVLKERERQTMESYQRLLTAQDATNVLRHEMRHHMLALSALLGDGDVDRAKRYVDVVAGELDRLPTGRYSANVLVDVVAGSFLDRAWSQGIQVEHHLSVPPELDIADEDLSVFLSNLLQNALEACERMDAARDRYIRVDMHLRGNFLFIKCVNSAPEEAEWRAGRPDHGYGLAAMRRVAEKYNSALFIDHTPTEFTVKSDLNLKRS